MDVYDTSPTRVNNRVQLRRFQYTVFKLNPVENVSPLSTSVTSYCHEIHLKMNF